MEDQYRPRVTWPLLRYEFLYMVVLVFLSLVLVTFIVTLTIVQFMKPMKLDDIDDKLNSLVLNSELYQLKNEKGKPDGYVPLNQDKKISPEFLPEFLSRVFVDLGCWDALTNTPTITGGVGEDLSYYTVCVSGNTTVDGESEWYYGDRILYVDQLFRWIRLDGGVMNITSEGTGSPLVLQGQGPIYSMAKINRGNSTFRASDIDGNNTIELFLSTTAVAQDISNVGDGSELITDGTGPDYSIKSLTVTSPLTINTIDGLINIEEPSPPLISGLGTVLCEDAQVELPRSSDIIYLRNSANNVAWLDIVFPDEVQRSPIYPNIYTVDCDMDTRNFVLNDDVLGTGISRGLDTFGFASPSTGASFWAGQPSPLNIAQGNTFDSFSSSPDLIEMRFSVFAPSRTLLDQLPP